MLGSLSRRVLARQGAAALRQSVRTSAVRAAAVVNAPFATSGARFLSTKDEDGSHSDFAPKFHAAVSKEKDEILKMIDSHVKTYPIMLYMKGTPSAPQCGFSMQVVRILHAQGVSFDSVNVLDHPEIREGVKEYSQWPTIPQLYVKGEFIGGCDIVSDMHKSGELNELLSEFKKE